MTNLSCILAGIRRLVFVPAIALLTITSMGEMAVATELRPAPPASTPAQTQTQEFWVWDLNVMPPGARRARATLRASGPRADIYVEDKFWETQISQDFVNRLKWRLEERAPEGAIDPNIGIIPLEEKIFGKLPRRARADDRMIVLFADLGKYKDHEFDGFFNAFDQLPDAEAMKKYGQHSNEANIIYLNGFRRSEAYTTGVIAHELQHLLTSGARPLDGDGLDLWLSESLAEGAMLLTGYPTDQSHVDRFVQNTGAFPLVSNSYVQYGPQLLFSSFLLDSLPRSEANPLAVLSRSTQAGRAAIESIFSGNAGLPINFDLIFGNFVAYVFEQSNRKSALPLSWNHQNGIIIPDIRPYLTLSAPTFTLNGALAPYSFVAIDLAEELAPNAVIEVKTVIDQNTPTDPNSCARNSSVLWKPIHRKRIALYAVGCESQKPNERVQFQLRVLDRTTP